MASLTAHVQSPVYGASKWGVMGWVRAIAPQLQTFDISINAVCPGLVDTPILGPGGGDMMRGMGMKVLDPEEVAEAHHRALTTLGDQLGNTCRLLRNDQYPRLVAPPGFQALGQCARSAARHHRIVPAETVVTIGANQCGRIRAPGQREPLTASRGECRDECAAIWDRRWPPGRRWS